MALRDTMTRMLKAERPAARGQMGGVRGARAGAGLQGPPRLDPADLRRRRRRARPDRARKTAETAAAMSARHGSPRRAAHGLDPLLPAHAVRPDRPAVPLSADLLGLRRRGDRAPRPLGRRLDGRGAHLPLPSLGRVRLRSAARESRRAPRGRCPGVTDAGGSARSEAGGRRPTPRHRLQAILRSAKQTMAVSSRPRLVWAIADMPCLGRPRPLRTGGIPDRPSRDFYGRAAPRRRLRAPHRRRRFLIVEARYYDAIGAAAACRRRPGARRRRRRATTSSASRARWRSRPASRSRSTRPRRPGAPMTARSRSAAWSAARPIISRSSRASRPAR